MVYLCVVKMVLAHCGNGNVEMVAWIRPFRDRQEEGQAEDEWFACERGGGEEAEVVPWFLA